MGDGDGWTVAAGGRRLDDGGRTTDDAIGRRATRENSSHERNANGNLARNGADDGGDDVAIICADSLGVSSKSACDGSRARESAYGPLRRGICRRLERNQPCSQYAACIKAHARSDRGNGRSHFVRRCGSVLAMEGETTRALSAGVGGGSRYTKPRDDGVASGHSIRGRLCPELRRTDGGALRRRSHGRTHDADHHRGDHRRARDTGRRARRAVHRSRRLDDRIVMTLVTGYAPVNGLQMYYQIEGTGDPLVFIHPAASRRPTCSVRAMVGRLRRTRSAKAR